MWLILVLSSVFLMSFNAYIVKLLVRRLRPALVLFYQYLIAIPVVGFYVLFSGAVINASHLPLLFLGLIYVGAIGCFYAGLRKGVLSKVSPIFNLKMIITVVLGVIILLEPLTLNLIIGLFLGVFSIYLLGGEG